MTTTFVKIQTATVGAGGASSIDFTSIPQTYTDLQIVCSLKSSYSGSQWSQVYVKFNTSSASMSNRYLFGNGSTFGSGADVNTTGGFATTGGTGGTSAFANNLIYISNYTSSNNKSFMTDTVPEMNAVSSLLVLSANLWSNSAAINAVSIVDYNASFVQYSTATLYGIKSS
jgi:hypothetical protein